MTFVVVEGRVREPIVPLWLFRILLLRATEDERSMYVAGIRHRQLLGG